MSESKKPMIFDIHFMYGSARVQLVSEDAFIKNEETIHVIEYSAYETLQQAYNDLKDRFKQEMINRGAEESYHENIFENEKLLGDK